MLLSGPADRGQPALGARTGSRARRAAGASRARRSRLGRSRRDRRRGRRDQSRDRRARSYPPRDSLPRRSPVHVLTHCNAGALATWRFGHRDGADLSRARRRHSAARLGERDAAAPARREADRLGNARGAASPHTLIVDSAGGLLMRRGDVDLVLVGADRVAANGDVCNKIGTYEKALAAHNNGIPFYVGAAVADDRLEARRRTTRFRIEARSPKRCGACSGRDLSIRSHHDASRTGSARRAAPSTSRSM